MATGQSAYLATLYGEVQYIDPKSGNIFLYGNGYANPIQDSLPVQATKITPVIYQLIQTAWGGVYVNTLVEVFPMGLQLPAKSKRYICDSTVAALNTLRT